MLSVSRKGESAFTTVGYDNWKKAIKKFGVHSRSYTHKEAKLKWNHLGKPSVHEKIDSQAKQLTASRRQALLKQLSGLKFLLRQGIAIRGHIEVEGNLVQLLTVWAENNLDLKNWIKDGKYKSHDIVNEQISFMGQSVIWFLLHCYRRSKKAHQLGMQLSLMRQQMLLTGNNLIYPLGG